MRRIFILLVLALLAVDAAAQQYPERRQVRKGNRAYEKGNYQDAAGRYMRALGADPSSFEAQYNLGNALHRQEMYDQAAQVQQQAAADSLAAPVDRAQAFYNLGNTQFRQQKYAEALESYKNSLRLNPDDPQEGDGQGDDQQQDGRPDKEQEGEGRPQPAGISPSEQERMLDAIQAQEDRTQEKLKEKAGAVVRLKKNW